VPFFACMVPQTREERKEALICGIEEGRSGLKRENVIPGRGWGKHPRRLRTRREKNPLKEE